MRHTVWGFFYIKNVGSFDLHTKSMGQDPYNVVCTSKLQLLQSSTLGSRDQSMGQGRLWPILSPLCVGPISDCCKVSNTDTDTETALEPGLEACED